MSGTTVGDVIIEIAKGVSLAREKPHKKGTRLPSRQKMQKPDSECANDHIINVIEVPVGFLGWIGNISEREKLVDGATGTMFKGSRLAAVSVLLAEPTARVGPWNSLAPVCHRRLGRCENHKTTSGSGGIVRSSCSLPYTRWTNYVPRKIPPLYDLDTLDLRSLQLMYECSDIWTNATVYLRQKPTAFTWKGIN